MRSDDVQMGLYDIKKDYTMFGGGQMIFRSALDVHSKLRNSFPFRSVKKKLVFVPFSYTYFFY